MAKYHVGQKLWLKPIYGNLKNGRSATIKAVGRKWVTLDCNRRFEVTRTLPAMADSNWWVYESEEDARRRHRISSNWSNLVAHLRYAPMPADMTTEKIIAAADLLGISYEVVNPKEKTDGN